MNEVGWSKNENSCGVGLPRTSLTVNLTLPLVFVENVRAVSHAVLDTTQKKTAMANLSCFRPRDNVIPHGLGCVSRCPTGAGSSRLCGGMPATGAITMLLTLKAHLLLGRCY